MGPESLALPGFTHMSTDVVPAVQRRPTYKVPRFWGRVPPDLEARGPLEAKSLVRGPKIDHPREGSSILNVDLVVVTAAVLEASLCLFLPLTRGVPGEVPHGHSPSKIEGCGPVPVRLRRG